MDRRIPISISLPESFLRLLDKSRGAIPRSQYILAILHKSVDLKRKCRCKTKGVKN